MGKAPGGDPLIPARADSGTVAGTGAGSAFSGERGERLAWTLLVAVLALAAAVLLYLNRGTTFWNDQLTWLGNLSGPHDLEYFLLPHNSHLIATTRAAYLLTAELAGPDYVVMRVLGVAGMLATATLFFVWAKPRIGPGWSLLPATLLLFYGSAWQHVVGPIGFTVSASIALGLGAMIALERRRPGYDVLAFGLLVLAVLTYTVALAFLVGAAVSVLLDRDRLRRAWIFLVPLAIYVAWWIWAQQFDQGRTDAANILHLGEFFARSMAANAGGITGLNILSLRIVDPGPVSDGSPSVLGWLAGAVLVVALVVRVRRGAVPRSFWAALAVLITFWLAAGLADLGRATQAAAIRYYLPGSTALLMVLVTAVAGRPIRGRWAYGLLAVFAFSLAMNALFLRDGADYLRGDAQNSRVQLSMLELRAGLEPGADGSQPAPADPEIAPGARVPEGAFAGQYLAAVARYGSPAMSLADVRALPAPLRQAADSALAADGGIAVVPANGRPPTVEGCRIVAAGGTLEAAPGFTTLKPYGDTAIAVTASRFSDPPGAPVGIAEPGHDSVLAIPADRASEPWIASFSPPARIRSCRVAPAG